MNRYFPSSWWSHAKLNTTWAQSYLFMLQWQDLTTKRLYKGHLPISLVPTSLCFCLRRIKVCHGRWMCDTSDCSGLIWKLQIFPEDSNLASADVMGAQWFRTLHQFFCRLKSNMTKTYSDTFTCIYWRASEELWFSDLYLYLSYCSSLGTT